MPPSHNTIAWYDAHAEEYAKSSIQSFLDTDQLDAFVKLLEPGAKVLDVGCGCGRDTNALQERGVQSSGIDLSKGLLDIAKREFPDLTFIHGSMTDLPFGDASFDGLWVHASLLHLETDEEVQQALSEFRRVLKKDGVMHILVQGRFPQDPIITFRGAETGQARLFHSFTEPEFQQLLENKGFTILHLEEYNEADKWPHGRKEIIRIYALVRKTTID